MILIGAVAVGLVVLHRVDGGEVTINPAQVTALRNPVGKYKQLAPAGNCAIDLTDRKFIMVLETCAEVKRILENAR